MPGYSENYYYISEAIAKFLIGARIVSVYCPLTERYLKIPGPQYETIILFDNGYKLVWHEDSEGPSGFVLRYPHESDY